MKNQGEARVRIDAKEETAKSKRKFDIAVGRLFPMGICTDGGLNHTRKAKRPRTVDVKRTAVVHSTAKTEKRKEHHLIEITETNERIDNLLKNLRNSSIESCTIFKVNVGLRESNQDAYTPKMISIGPYHKKNPQLGPMEKYKLLYLQRFLERKEGLLDVKSYINQLHTLKEKALKCYDDITDDNHEFCQMLLLDGCFVVEFTREHFKGPSKDQEGVIINPNRASYIFRDLMLLENQLPFFVLDQLHSMTKQVNESSLAILVNKLAVRFSNMLIKMNLQTPNSCNVENIKHLLHVVHIFSCHGMPIKKFEDDNKCHKVMPNATYLSEAGFRFAKADDKTHLFDIKFDSGLMTIPCLRVEDGTEILLRNLIAYEQQSSDVHPIYFSDYATFMNHLIDSGKDVNLLRHNEIIENWIGDEKEVANLFNKIGNGVTAYPDFYYKAEFRLAAEHSRTTWNRMMANLKSNYFSSPWAGASTLAAFILLLLTTIQTILAITSAVK